MVVTIGRDSRFSTLAQAASTTVTAALTSSAVVTAAGVKTCNGELAVTTTITAGAARETRGQADLAVTASLPLTILGDFFVPTSRAVTARLTASARIPGQPLPDTPPERAIYISADDRDLDIPNEFREVVIPDEDRSVYIARA
jgi:hypothetical protein